MKSAGAISRPRIVLGVATPLMVEGGGGKNDIFHHRSVISTVVAWLFSQEKGFARFALRCFALVNKLLVGLYKRVSEARDFGDIVRPVEVSVFSLDTHRFGFHSINGKCDWPTFSSNHLPVLYPGNQ